MAPSVSWLALGSLASGVASLAFIRYLWSFRDKPGARFFIATIGCEALWALSYGAALFVFDPTLRPLFEIPIWLGINFIGVCYLAFALEYTGRSTLVRSSWMRGIVLLQVVHTAIVVTNPLHHLAWRNYHIEPVFGAATVVYTHQLWVYVNVTGVILMIAAAFFLLADTFYSYGPLYRKQTAAVALSPVLPGVAFLLWLGQVGRSPPLNLTPLTFPIHLAFDAYAFFSHNMFEMTPAARRAGERAAIDDLGTAVVIVDDDERIINLNQEARRILGLEPNAALGHQLDAHLPDIDPTASEQTVSLMTGGKRREYAVTTSSLEDVAGNRVGYTIVLQDITTERRREQRLSVLNRVLRHNLRNDLNVVQGHLNIATERIADEEIRDLLRTAESRTAELIDLSEKARAIEQTMESAEAAPNPVAVHDLLEDIAADFRPSQAGSVRLDVPADLRLRTNERLLRDVFSNLIENGIEHNDADNPMVEVVLVETDTATDRATFEIRDNGSGIPEYELTVLESQEETALEHGSGLGLWLVRWGVASLGGTIQFEADETGTTVILELPHVIRNNGDGADETEGETTA